MKTLTRSVRADIEYPSSDGEPLAESSLQLDWIFLLVNGLTAQFRDDKDTVVAADLFWYPVEGDSKTATAADVMVVFGRPKQDRMSYMQWKEENIGPQVTIEVCSPSNSKKNLQATFEFYDRFGVEEYYLIDPRKHTLQGWRRIDGDLKKIKSMVGWVSPRLGIRFQPKPDGLHVFGSDGREFLMNDERVQLEAWTERERRNEIERLKAETERSKVETKRLQDETKRLQNEAEGLKAQAEIRRLSAKLRELGIDPESS